jgi:hypothetical protein
VIVEAQRELKQALEARLAGVELVMVPHSTEFDNKMLSVLPVVVMQGPRIDFFKRDHEIKSEVTGTNEFGIETRELKKSRIEQDLVFRLRVFSDKVIECSGIIEDLIVIFQSLIKIDVGSESYNVSINNSFESTLVPSFDDVKHFETLMTIEAVSIETGEVEEVFGAGDSGLNVDDGT